MTTIYTRNKEGDLTPLNIPAIKGKDGINGVDGVTPKITVGEVTTLPAGEKATVTIDGTPESPVLNFSIPKGKDGDGSRNSCDIDDNEISEENTWSSDKITTWSIEQDGVHWVEKEDNFISAENTYEYKLKEIEIFGDTVQGFKDEVTHQQIVDSIKATGLDDGCRLNDDGTFTVLHANVNNNGITNKEGFIQLKPNTEYSTYCWRDNGAYPIVFYTLYEDITITKAGGFTTGESGKVLLYPMSAQNGKLKLRVVEGKHDLSKYPYDYNLSNIEHVGELYVDKKGEPKLDEHGNKQYKINIRSVDGLNLLNLNPETWTPIPNKPDVLSEIIKVKPKTTYTYKQKKWWWRGLKQVDGHGNEIKMLFSACEQNEVFTTPEDCEYIQMYCGQGNNQQPLFREMFLYEGTEDLPFTKEMFSKDYKQTIILPCQLSRVGNVKDRLFWDESKGKYIVEKNVGNFTLDENSNVEESKFNNTSIPYKTFNMTIPSNIDYGGPYYQTEETTFSNICDWTDWATLHGKEFEYYTLGVSNMFVLRLSDNRDILDVDSFIEYIRENNIVVYYKHPTPQLIETDIIEPITLPTYNNKTYLYINNTNNAKGTIKAKFPLKTSNVVLSLDNINTKNHINLDLLKDSNLDILSADFDISFRVSQIEWALEDNNLPISNLKDLKLNNSIDLSRFEQAKILIEANKYNKEKMTYQLTRYLERGYLKQEEFDILIELMN